MIRFFLKQYFSGKSVLFAVGLLYVFLLSGAWEDLNGQADALLIFQISTELGVAVMLRPIAAALPIAFFLMREWGTGYHSFALCRSSCGSYAASKVIAAWLAGFTVPFASCLLLLLTMAVLSPSALTGIAGSTVRIFPGLMENGRPLPALFLYIGAFSLAGAIWSVVIVGLSMLTTNGYILIAAPFLLERVLSYILQFFCRFEPMLLCFDTSQSYACHIRGGLGIQFVYSVFLSAAMFLLVFLGTKRRLRHG